MAYQACLDLARCSTLPILRLRTFLGPPILLKREPLTPPAGMAAPLLVNLAIQEKGGRDRGMCCSCPRAVEGSDQEGRYSALGSPNTRQAGERGPVEKGRATILGSPNTQRGEGEGWEAGRPVPERRCKCSGHPEHLMRWEREGVGKSG